jgi:hypothetical protein
MNKLIILFYLLISFSVLSSPCDDVLYNKVLSAISHQNNKLLTDDEYDLVLDRIADGDTQWISLYPQLIKSPFSGVLAFQEGLSVSLAYALPVNPQMVLKFVSSNNIEQVCGMPFFQETDKSLHQYYAKTIMALTKNNNASACLNKLNNAMIKIQQRNQSTINNHQVLVPDTGEQ